MEREEGAPVEENFDRDGRGVSQMIDLPRAPPSESTIPFLPVRSNAKDLRVYCTCPSCPGRLACASFSGRLEECIHGSGPRGSE